MHAQYIAEGTVDAPLLLFGQVTTRDAAALTAALMPLAVGWRGSVALHRVAGWSRASGVRVDAISADRDLGCSHVESSDQHFRCAFQPATWDQIVSLLAPFASDGSDEIHAHQYLSERGPVTWMVSTDSTW
jgi:hypothetical protein